MITFIVVYETCAACIKIHTILAHSTKEQSHTRYTHIQIHWAAYVIKQVNIRERCRMREQAHMPNITSKTAAAAQALVIILWIKIVHS